MKIQTRDLTPELWPELEKLFGPNGACGGCWCMSWRTEKGEDWSKLKGATAKARFKKLVTTGAAHGVLAFIDGKAVGWCALDPRKDYAKLDRAPSFTCEDAEKVWSLPCFFVHKDHRGDGVAKALLAHALGTLKKLGAEVAEGYPVKPAKDRKPLPHAFAWTGTVSLFKAAGFEPVGKRDGGKQRMRRAP